MPGGHRVLAKSSTLGSGIPFRDLLFAAALCRPRTIDAAIKGEASQCDSDFPGFLTEMAQVLRLGGHVLYADFRFRDGFTAFGRPSLPRR